MKPLNNYRQSECRFPVTDWGKWAPGPVRPKRLIPLHKGYPLSARWRWRAIRFKAFGHDHIVLLCHKMGNSPPLPELRLVLFSVPRVGHGVAVCRVEYHPSHPGWHVHYQPFRTMQKGVIRARPEFRRDCPNGARIDLRSSMPSIERVMLAAAIDIFGLQPDDSPEGEMN